MFNFFKSHQSVRSVTADEAFEKISNGGVQFIDVRNPDEYQMGHAKGAVNIPFDSLHEQIHMLNTNNEVYVICRSGVRSVKATKLLSTLGVNAINVLGGTMEWQAKGLPIE